jgi:hypothetical protein
MSRRGNTVIRKSEEVRYVYMPDVKRLEWWRQVVGADAAFLLFDEFFGCVLNLHGETELRRALFIPIVSIVILN